MQNTHRSRSSIIRRLGLAGAGSVTFVATSSAQASIVTSGINNKTGSFVIDVDQDNTDDLTFFVTDGKGTDILEVFGMNGAKVAESTSGWAAQLDNNTLINSAIDYSNNNISTLAQANTTLSQWGEPFPENGYLGVQLSSGDFGWLEVTTTSYSEIIVHQWAYEDSGAAILAGDTGTSVVPIPPSFALFASAIGAVALRKIIARKT